MAQSKYRLTMQRPSLLKHPVARLRGNVVAQLEVFDGRKNKYVPINPKDIKVLDI